MSANTAMNGNLHVANVETGTPYHEKGSPATESSTMTKEKTEATTQAVSAPGGSEIPGYEYPALPQLISITAAVLLAVLPVALDATILAAAIPTITDYFGSTDDIAWYAGIYPLTICASQLAFGKLYALYSIKWVYIASIVIFEVGSTICAAAPTSAVLIVGRAIAGIGCAGIVGGSFTLAIYAVPLEKRPLFLGVVSSVFGIGIIAGPPVGGAFSTNVSWRWCFWINLPIGAVAVLLIVLLFKAPPRTLQRRSGLWGMIWETDPIGSVILLGAAISLFLALTWGGSKHDWNSGTIIALLVVAIACILGFIADQYFNDEHATIPRRLIRQRTVAGASWFAFCNSAGAWTLIYFIPIWFQSVLGVSAQQSGTYMLAAILPALLASVLGGAFMTLVGYYNPVLILGSVLSAAGAGCLTLWTPQTTKAEWIGFQVLYGLGFGLIAQAPLIVVQAVLPPEDMPAGVALITFMQAIGGTIIIGIAQSIFFNRLLGGLGELLGTAFAKTAIETGATNYRSQIPASLLVPIVNIFNDAIIKSWYTSVVMASLGVIGALACEWRNIKTVKVVAGGN